MNLYNSRTFVSGILRIRSYSFQGRSVSKAKCVAERHQCQCLGWEQRRTFVNFPTTNRQWEYNGRQLVGYSIEQMFEVVSDVENYYKFVPWCKKSIVRHRTSDHLKADIVVGFPPINDSYTSSVTLIKPHLVKAISTDGRIFNYMNTVWRFGPGLKREQQSCVVDFQLTFQFKSALHSQLSNIFFDQVVREMESAFLKEATKRNGPPTLKSFNLLN